MTEASLQGDYRFVEILAVMGARVEKYAHATVISATQPLRGIDIDMHHISDTVMTLAAIAPLCVGPTTIRNVANIRIKETDRLIATVTELRRIGQEVEHGEDWLRITPRPIRPATIACYGDHRMAMSFAILAANARDHYWDANVAGDERRLFIEDPDCTAKTYPRFWHDLFQLYPGNGQSTGARANATPH
jgi:3-phosphoshikimate 1-carboxyvinyltransferase